MIYIYIYYWRQLETHHRADMKHHETNPQASSLEPMWIGIAAGIPMEVLDSRSFKTHSSRPSRFEEWAHLPVAATPGWL